MDDVGRVHVLEASQDLVDEELDVVVAEVLRTLDDRGEVGVHQVGHHVQVVEGLARLGQHDRVEAHDLA